MRGEATARLTDGPVQQAFRQGRCHQVADTPGAGGFAEHGDVAGIASEGGDVVPDPFECRHLVEDAVVTGDPMRGLGGEFRMREESQHTESVVDADRDDSLAGKRVTVVHRQVAVSDLQPTAVYPHHDRQCVTRPGASPDV